MDTKGKTIGLKMDERSSRFVIDRKDDSDSDSDIITVSTESLVKSGC